MQLVRWMIPFLEPLSLQMILILTENWLLTSWVKDRKRERV